MLIPLEKHDRVVSTASCHLHRTNWDTAGRAGKRKVMIRTVFSGSPRCGANFQRPLANERTTERLIQSIRGVNNLLYRQDLSASRREFVVVADESWTPSRLRPKIPRPGNSTTIRRFNTSTLDACAGFWSCFTCMLCSRTPRRKTGMWRIFLVRRSRLGRSLGSPCDEDF